MYVAFDILHDGKQAVLTRTLEERRALLREAVVPDAQPGASAGLLVMARDALHSRGGTDNALPSTPPPRPAVPLLGSQICGRVVTLVPGVTTFNGVMASRIGSTQEVIREALAEVGWGARRRAGGRRGGNGWPGLRPHGQAAPASLAALAPSSPSPVCSRHPWSRYPCRPPPPLPAPGDTAQGGRHHDQGPPLPLVPQRPLLALAEVSAGRLPAAGAAPACCQRLGHQTQPLGAPALPHCLPLLWPHPPYLLTPQVQARLHQGRGEWQGACRAGRRSPQSHALR